MRHTPPRATNAAILELPGTAAGLCAGMHRLLAGAGWQVATIGAEHLEQPSGDLTIILAPGVNEASLLLAARAARRRTPRVAYLAPERDPLLIADVLRSGVDAYLLTPLEPAECLARLTALANYARSLRGKRQPTQRSSGVILDHTTRSVREGATRVVLSTSEWAVLEALLARGEQLASAADLARSLWGSPDDDARVISAISRLRRKLASAGVEALAVVTVRGRGYRAQMI